MPVLKKWEIAIDADAVLRGQGADPAAVRRRRPSLVRIAQRACDEALPLLTARVLHQRLPVEELRHEQVRLRNDKRLQGPLLAQHLARADEVVLVLCTVGGALEKRSSEIWKADPVYAMALDGAGSAGVEALAGAVCAYFDEHGRRTGQQASIPLSPGMVGWPFEQGQPEIFSILDPSEIEVQLTPSMRMIPRKSLTFVLGFGERTLESARTCDYCRMNETCRYQDHYA